MLDVIVIGMGAHGSAGLFHLAKKGFNVLGLEQFDQIHNNGSYHGLSRIIRMGLYEGDTYLPLAKRQSKVTAKFYTLEKMKDKLKEHLDKYTPVIAVQQQLTSELIW